MGIIYKNGVLYSGGGEVKPEEISEIVNSGVKNLLNATLAKSKTIDGIEWTVNDDGTVTANGTATALSVFDVLNTEYNIGEHLPNGEYILSDGGAAIENDTLDYSQLPKVYMAMTYIKQDESTEYNVAITPRVTKFVVDDTVKEQYVGLCVNSGVTVEDLVFKPMIRKANIVDDTFTEYAMTNAELTKFVLSYVTADEVNSWFS